MDVRKKVLFKINNEVVLEESTDIFLNEIDELKWQIAVECEVSIDDIDVEIIEFPIGYSEDVDVGVKGMVFWKDLFHKPIVGVSCLLEEGTDEYLDAINNGTIENYLVFTI
jgi:hypothetical protein